MAELRLLFVGSGAVNFGGAEGPWDHSRRLEQLGGVKIVAIADPDLPKAQEVLKRKQNGAHGDLYRDCKVYADYKDALKAEKPDVAFIGKSTIDRLWVHFNYLLLYCNFQVFRHIAMVVWIHPLTLNCSASMLVCTCL